MMKPAIPATTKQGFTLVEVALAILAIGLGVLVIFGLFPAGMQNADDDAADTKAGLFAEYAMSGVRGAASGLTNTTDWAAFQTKMSSMPGCPGVSADGVMHELLFPLGNEDIPANRLRYILTTVALSPTLYSVTLQVCDGKYGGFTPQNVFYTEFVYMGM